MPDLIKKLWYKLLSSRMDDLLQVLRMHYGASRVNFATLDPNIVPGRISGFHDLAYLFAGHYATRGIIAQDIDEAAYLWKTIVERKPGLIMEIGRWLGGSTVLITSAASQYPGGRVTSIDLKVKAPDFAKDERIESHLKGLGLSNYKLNIGSSFDFDPGEKLDMAFIDGDHSYQGVKKDLVNARKYLKPGADILFHDACASRPYSTIHEPVAQLMREMKSDAGTYTLVAEVGSISHFRLRS